jgi:hypothetical protein
VPQGAAKTARAAIGAAVQEKAEEAEASFGGEKAAASRRTPKHRQECLCHKEDAGLKPGATFTSRSRGQMLGRQRPKAKSRSLTPIREGAIGFGMTIGGSGEGGAARDAESAAVEEKARRPKQASAGRKRRQAAALQSTGKNACATEKMPG